MVRRKLKTLIACSLITTTVLCGGSTFIAKATPVDTAGDSSQLIASTLPPKTLAKIENAKVEATKALSIVNSEIAKVNKSNLTGVEADRVVSLAKDALDKAKIFHDLQNQYRIETTESRKAIRKAWLCLDKTSNFYKIGKQNDEKHQQAVAKASKESKNLIKALEEAEKKSTDDLTVAKNATRGFNETNATLEQTNNAVDASKVAVKSANIFKDLAVKILSTEGLSITDKKVIKTFEQKAITSVWIANAQMREATTLKENVIKYQKNMKDLKDKEVKAEKELAEALKKAIADNTIESAKTAVEKAEVFKLIVDGDKTANMDLKVKSMNLLKEAKAQLEKAKNIVSAKEKEKLMNRLNSLDMYVQKMQTLTEYNQGKQELISVCMEIKKTNDKDLVKRLDELKNTIVCNLEKLFSTAFQYRDPLLLNKGILASDILISGTEEDLIKSIERVKANILIKSMESDTGYVFYKKVCLNLYDHSQKNAEVDKAFKFYVNKLFDEGKEATLRILEDKFMNSKNLHNLGEYIQNKLN